MWQVSDTVRTHAVEQDSRLRNQATDTDGLKQQIGELNRQIKAQATTIKGLEATNISLSSSGKDAAAEISALEGKLKARDKEIFIVRDTETALEQETENLKEEIQRLTAIGQLLRARKATLAKDNDKLKGDLSSCQSQLEERKVGDADLRAAVASKDALLEEQRIQLQDHQQRIAKLEQADAASRKHILDVETQLLESGRCLEKANVELSTSHALCLERAKEVRASNAELAMSQKVVEDLRKQNTKESSELMYQRRELDQKSSELKNLQAELGQKSSELNGLREGFDQKSSQLRNLQVELDRKSSKLNGLREELDQKSSDLDARDGETKELRNKIKACDGNLATSKNDCERLRKENAGLKSSVKGKDLTISSLDQQMLDMESQRDAVVREAHNLLTRLADLERKAPLDAKSATDLVSGGSILPRRADSNRWIGLVEAEEMIGASCKTTEDALLAPYRTILDSKLEILIDGRVLPRGFTSLPSSDKEEVHTLEEAGVSITDGDMQCNTTFLILTTHGELNRRDLALKIQAKMDAAPEEKKTESDCKAVVASQLSITPPDPRLRNRPMATGPAPVAVMVPSSPQSNGPVKQPTEAEKQPLRRISTDVTSDAGSLQTPALTNDENMSPKDSGPITPRSPLIPSKDSSIPNASKRKEHPVELFDVASRRSGEPVELIDQRDRRSNSVKRQRTADVQDPRDIAPRGPKRSRESNEAYNGGRREHDVYDGRRRDDERRESYYANEYYQPPERRGSGRPSPDYGYDRRRKWR